MPESEQITIPQLTERQELILSLIVREYIRQGEPIGSKYLTEKYELGVSPATVRNDMAVLEEYGYITAPHTSAGRVPTQEGYRYFVRRLLGETELPQAEQRTIRHQFHQVRLDVEQWMQLAATVLARTTRGASLVTPPHAVTSRFKHLELISVEGRLVLMVLVLHGGDVRQQMLTLAEPVAQEKLSNVATRLNSACANLTADGVRATVSRMPVLEREVGELAADIMEQADTQPIRTIYRDGLIALMDELDKSLGAQQALRVLEEESLLESILHELGLEIGGVQVVIGGEGKWEELSHCSMVLSRYGITGKAVGALGVLGPVRMHYGRAISAVRYMAGLMSDLMYEVYGEEPE